MEEKKREKHKIHNSHLYFLIQILQMRACGAKENNKRDV